MNNLTTKKTLLSHILGLATAGLLIASPSVLAAGGSGAAAHEDTGTMEQQQSVGTNRQGTDMEQQDQELGGTQGMDDTDETEAFDQESRITGTDNQQGQPQTLSDLSQEEIQDREVVNLEGQELGSVQEVVTDADGSVSGVVLSVGGTLGMGGSEIFASADEIQVTEDQLVWQTSLDEDALAEQEEYQAAGTMNQQP